MCLQCDECGIEISAEVAEFSPICDACYEASQQAYYESMDGDHASGLASAGFGTDEDYHYDSYSNDWEG